ncbi:SseA Rhodanese-related sulfurtransferase [Rhabdaerophilaceae bacterium]
MMQALAPLLSCDWLDGHLDQPDLVLIDLRLAVDGGVGGYREGHIPGAVFSDYAADGWRMRVGDVPGLLPDAAHLAGLFGRLGIVPESHVILIPAGTSANDLAASARAYWTLRVAGHSRISILDGGTRGWRLAGYPIELLENTPSDCGPYPVHLDLTLRSQAADVGAVSAQTLMDARSRSYFVGAEKAPEARRAGHIPGAVSADYTENFDKDRSSLRPKNELDAHFANVPKGPVISYCNTGHTAALNWFVLSEVLARPAVTLYDGSMTDWTQDDARPVETGPNS